MTTWQDDLLFLWCGGIIAYVMWQGRASLLSQWRSLLGIAAFIGITTTLFCMAAVSHGGLP